MSRGRQTNDVALGHRAYRAWDGKSERSNGQTRNRPKRTIEPAPASVGIGPSDCST
jgi:hypothetical protein